MHRSRLCLTVAAAIVVSGCVEYPNANDPATAAAYASWKECTRKEAVAMAYVNQKPGWVAAEAMVRCYHQEVVFKEKAGMAEYSSNMNQLKSFRWRDLVIIVLDMRAKRQAR